MPNESLSDKAVSAIALLNEIEQEMADVNDYGEITGFCDDHNQRVDDFHSALGSLRARASRLRSRLKKRPASKPNIADEGRAKRVPSGRWLGASTSDAEKL